MAATLIYGKAKYVSLLAIVDLDLFLHYLGDQANLSCCPVPLKVN